MRLSSKMLLDDLKAAMELKPPGLSGIERQIWASACIVSYYNRSLVTNLLQDSSLAI